MHMDRIRWPGSGSGSYQGAEAYSWPAQGLGHGWVTLPGDLNEQGSPPRDHLQIKYGTNPIIYMKPGVYKNAFILPHGAPFSCVLARSFAFCRGVVLGLSRRGTALGLVLAYLGLSWLWIWLWMITSRVLAFAIFFFTKKTRFLSDNIYESKINKQWND